MDLTWVEISRSALRRNIEQMRALVGSEVILCPCIKANAYGHGLVICGKTFLEAGADWLGVNALYEAEALREAGVNSPIYILGYTAKEDLGKAVELDCRLIVYNRATINLLGELGKKVKVHVKVETGNNRQGVLVEELVDFVKYAQSFSNIEVEGLTTHFANIEDTTDHSYAQKQLKKFKEADILLREAGVDIKMRHCANSAAVILFEKTYFEMVRSGIANYGMWPSNETYLSFMKERGVQVELVPALTWKTRVAQVKWIERGSYIGYGCTYKTTRRTKLAILPVGYYDGYDRGISNQGYVLIRGQRAPVRGRICMNIMMVDVTDIEGIEIEDEVVLMGQQMEEVVSAEQFAAWASTINYEVTTRINERVPRKLVE